MSTQAPEQQDVEQRVRRFEPAVLRSFLDQIADRFNIVQIPRLFAVNNFQGYKALPKLRHGAVETIDLDTLGNFLKNIASAGAVPFGNDLEDRLQNHLLQLAGLPPGEPGAIQAQIDREEQAARSASTSHVET